MIAKSLRVLLAITAATTATSTTMAGCTPRGRWSPAESTNVSAAVGPVSIPADPPVQVVNKQRVASHLDNPRGLIVLNDRHLKVALAGTGSGDTGAIVSLRDANGDGIFAGDGEREVILAGQPSANAIDIVRRDEVFGPASIATGDGMTMATVAFFGGPSIVFRIDGPEVVEWGKVHGNLNSITYDSGRAEWYAVSSTSDAIVRLRRGKGADRVIKLPPLDQGQDPVPGYLRYEPRSRSLMVSLFSGSIVGEEGGDGSELALRAGKIVRVDPESKNTTVVIEHLTAPTDLVLDPCGNIYVLEMCDAFLDPIQTLDNLDNPGHGGFRRFSGRLLRVDTTNRDVSVIATDLDAPTNLALLGDKLYVAGGMGTPGRMIPGPAGPTRLIGYIDRLDLGDLICE